MGRMRTGRSRSMLFDDKDKRLWIYWKVQGSFLWCREIEDLKCFILEIEFKNSHHPCDEVGLENGCSADQFPLVMIWCSLVCLAASFIPAVQGTGSCSGSCTVSASEMISQYIEEVEQGITIYLEECTSWCRFQQKHSRASTFFKSPKELIQYDVSCMPLARWSFVMDGC